MINQIITSVKFKFRQTLKLYILLFVPMWTLFILNNSLLVSGEWNNLGIKPREVGALELVGVLCSWTMHANVQHIISNTVVMAQLLFLFSIFERNVFRVFILLIVTSGVFTWLLGSDNSNHIGASGLAFAMMGFMIGRALFAKRWEYFIACIVLGASFWLAMLQGLVPKIGISFAGHFGGLIAGLIFGAKYGGKMKLT